MRETYARPWLPTQSRVDVLRALLAKGDDMKNGDIVKDRVTGFKGMVVCISEWLNGCRRVTVQPTELDEKGEVRKTEAFDVEQLDVIQASAYGFEHAKTGGPMPDPVRR